MASKFYLIYKIYTAKGRNQYKAFMLLKFLKLDYRKQSLKLKHNQYKILQKIKVKESFTIQQNTKNHFAYHLVLIKS